MDATSMVCAALWLLAQLIWRVALVVRRTQRSANAWLSRASTAATPPSPHVNPGGVGVGHTVLVTTGRQVKTLHIVRALKATGARVVVTDYQPMSASAASVACDAFHVLPPLDTSALDEWVEHFGALLRRENVDVVLPVSTINEALFLGVARDALQAELPHVRWLCGGVESTLALDHRERFARLCDAAGVAAPEHGVVHSAAQLQQHVPWRRMDVVLKRIESSVNRAEEVLLLRHGQPPPAHCRPSAADPWQWQRRLHGEEYSAWYVVEGGRVTFSAAYRSEPDLLCFDGMRVPPDVDAPLRRLLRRHRLSGQYAFDYIRSRDDGRAYVFECNPRASSILETVARTPLWGECFFGVDVRGRTRFADVGFWLHRNCWPFVGARGEAVFELDDAAPLLVAELSWPLELLRSAWRRGQRVRHVDANIGKAVTHGASPPRHFAVFERRAERLAAQRAAASVAMADDGGADGDAGVELVVDATLHRDSIDAIQRAALSRTSSRPHTRTHCLVVHVLADDGADGTAKDEEQVEGDGVIVEQLRVRDGAELDAALAEARRRQRRGAGRASTSRAVLRESTRELLFAGKSAPLGGDMSALSLLELGGGDGGGAAASLAGARALPLRRLTVLHVVGAVSSEYYAGVSRYYAHDCIRSIGNELLYRHVVAYVHVGGEWTLPMPVEWLMDDDGGASPSLKADATTGDGAAGGGGVSAVRAAREGAPRLALPAALDAIASLGVDVMLPHMFDYEGMTLYRALFDTMDVPYVGNDATAMAVSTHKARTKAMVAAAGVRTPASELLGRDEVRRGLRRRWRERVPPLPVVVKPAEEDNSQGIALARSGAELDAALAAAFEFGDEVLVEQFVPLGRELRVGVVERQRGGADGGVELEMLPATEYFFADAKRTPIRRPQDKLETDSRGVATVMSPSTQRQCPAALDDALRDKLHDLAERSHRALSCRDYSLYDVRVDERGEPFFIEACLYCSFAAKSAIIIMADAAGNAHPRLFQQLVERAVARSDRVAAASDAAARDGAVQILGTRRK